jgi:hypothetical protein
MQYQQLFESLLERFITKECGSPLEDFYEQLKSTEGEDNDTINGQFIGQLLLGSVDFQVYLTTIFDVVKNLYFIDR